MQPEFVLSVGDLIEGGRKPAEQIKAEWDELNAMIGKLQMKVLLPLRQPRRGQSPTRPNTGKRKLGRSHYHFVYHNVLFLILNTEDPPNSGGFHLGDEQLAWAEQCWPRTRGVRWTIVSMHKPIWTRPDVEKDRTLTPGESAGRLVPTRCVVGHVHRFQKFVRNGGGLLSAGDHRRGARCVAWKRASSITSFG